MPFKSKAQQGFMFAKHPKFAQRWAKEYGIPKDLPKKLGKKVKKGKPNINRKMAEARG